MRVLVVDDHRDTADCLARLLRVTDCDGVSALEEATKFLPDLLLADLGMPTMDGNELARQIRRCRSLDATVLAALTGYADAEHRELAAAAGFTEYVVKPVPFRLICVLLQRVADRIAASRQMVAVRGAECAPTVMA